MTNGEYIGSGASTTKLLLHLNGSSADSSGNNNNGTDTAITYQDGKFGKCASFNGSTSKIIRTDILGFNINGNNNISVSLWFNASALPASGAVATLFYFGMDPSSGTRYFYRYWIKNTSGVYSISGNTRASYNFTPTLGSWYNVVVTIDTSQNNKLYIDGALVASNTANDSATATNYPRFSIGASDYGVATYDYLNGKIDECIVENKIWTPQEVAKYYANAKGRYATL